MTTIFRLKILIISLICVFYVNINAQEFEWEGKLPKVEQDGFYKILISPGVTSKLKNQFADVRIYGENNKEVPYIFESEKPLSYSDYFVEYNIIEKTEQSFWPFYTRLVIHNPKKNKISNIQLLIRNSDVSKWLKLNGSDDQKKWYSIKDDYRFQAMYSDESTSVIKIIDFPLSNYEYYEILINDWRNQPLNIQKAGYFNTAVEEGKYTVIENPVINQLELEKEKQSLVKLNFKGIPQIDKVTFKITGPEFYYRNAELQVRDSSKTKGKEYDYYFRTVGSITLSSNSENTLYLDNLRVAELYVRISNNDNEPLKVTEVIAEQLNSYLICKIEKEKAYSIRFGDNKLNAPNYDLVYFKDKIPNHTNVLQITAIQSIKGKPTGETPTGIQLNKIFIWVAIVAVVILLLYMITRMMKEMKKSNNPEMKG